MKFSFFGTCFDDSELLLECLKSISNQSIKAKEVIIIDSGKISSIEKEIHKIFKKSETLVIYKYIKLPRVKALNYAISLSSSDYLFRYDSRARFSKNYAEEAIKLLKNKNNDNVGAVGGRQSPYPFNNNKNSILAAELMDRAYIFGNPLYRRKNYSGKVNSIYLGCFPTKILKDIGYRDDVSLISEDSQLSQDIISKGYKIYISQNLKVKYLCRESINSIIKLLRIYGRCRARTIISTKTIHDKKKYFLLFFAFFILPIALFLIFNKNIILTLISIFFVPMIYNIYNEILDYGYKKVFYMPFLALLTQINWTIGLFETFLFYVFFKNKKSNYF